MARCLTATPVVVLNVGMAWRKGLWPSDQLATLDLTVVLAATSSNAASAELISLSSFRRFAFEPLLLLLLVVPWFCPGSLQINVHRALGGLVSLCFGVSISWFQGFL